MSSLPGPYEPNGREDPGGIGASCSSVHGGVCLVARAASEKGAETVCIWAQLLSQQSPVMSLGPSVCSQVPGVAHIPAFKPRATQGWAPTFRLRLPSCPETRVGTSAPAVFPGLPGYSALEQILAVSPGIPGLASHLWEDPQASSAQPQGQHLGPGAGAAGEE